MSAGKTGPGWIVPGRQGGPRKQRRFDTPFALGMAAGLLINLALFMALYFRADPPAVRPQPQAIPVELVKQPPAPKTQAQQQTKPQPKPTPQPEPKKAEQPKIHTKYKSSGGSSQDEPQGAPETGSPDIKEKLKEAERQAQEAERDKQKKQAEEKKKGGAEEHAEPIGPLPAWARHVTQGFGAAKASRGADASGAVGGGNLYLNKMRDKISAAIAQMDVPLPAHAAEYSITVLRNGQVTDVKLTKSSGNKAFDEGGYAAIIRASPFDPLPAYIDGDYVTITFTFRPQ